MRKFAINMAVGLFAFSAANGAVAEEYKGEGFSGVAWIGEGGGKVERMGDVHVGKPGFVMNIEAQGERITALIKWDSDVAWSIMHSQKMYMEVPPEQIGLGMYEDEACYGFADGKKVGTESVSGRNTEKWACTDQTILPEGEAPSDATVWYDPSLGMAIKSVSANGDIFEIRDIKEGAPSASLFEIPAGYKIFDMNAMMMQMQMMQQQQQQ